MKKTRVLENLLSLCRRHLQLVIEENWEEWESAVTQKQILYGRLEQLKDMPLSDGDEELLFEIKRLEGQTNQKLRSKRKETKQKIGRINRVKAVLKGYEKAIPHNTARNGLRLEA